MAKRPPSSSVSSPIVRVRPEISPRASALGWNDSFSAAASTRSRVAGATSSRPLSAFDAVATDTPASRATSVSVTEPDRCLVTPNLSVRVSHLDTTVAACLTSRCRKGFRNLITKR